jgi:hypothetical protein
MGNATAIGVRLPRSDAFSSQAARGVFGRRASAQRAPKNARRPGSKNHRMQTTGGVKTPEGRGFVEGSLVSSPSLSPWTVCVKLAAKALVTGFSAVSPGDLSRTTALEPRLSFRRQ